MEENKPRQTRKIINVLIQIAPRKIEQSDLGKKTNLPPIEMSHIYHIHLKKIGIIEKKKDNKKHTFYHIPEDKIMEALKVIDSL
jgi:hypothetical protein